jgi:hypothetical protein
MVTFLALTLLSVLIAGILITKYRTLITDPTFFTNIISNNNDKNLLSAGEFLFLKFVFEVPGILFGAIFGVLGSLLNFLRVARLARQDQDQFRGAVIELSIGALMGVIAYLIVQSRSLPKLLHPSIDFNNIPDTTMYVAALVCFVAGLFSGELIETAERRVRQIAGTRRRTKE